MRWIWMLSGVLVGCGPDVAIPVWERIDIDELSTELDNPNAPLDDFDRSVGAISELERLIEALLDIEDGLDDVIGAGGEAVGPNEDPMPLTQEGSVVFVEIACPGPDLEAPVLDFSQGWVRVDIPQFILDLYESMMIEGDLLLTFDQCRVGNALIVGSSPAFLEGGERLALRPDILVRSVDDSTESLTIETAVLYEPRAFRFHLLSADRETFTVSVERSDATRFQVRAVDGEISCTIEDAVCLGL